MQSPARALLDLEACTFFAQCIERIAERGIRATLRQSDVLLHLSKWWWIVAVVFFVVNVVK